MSRPSGSLDCGTGAWACAAMTAASRSAGKSRGIRHGGRRFSKSSGVAFQRGRRIANPPQVANLPHKAANAHPKQGNHLPHNGATLSKYRFSFRRIAQGTTLQLHSWCQIVYDLRVSREQAFCPCATTSVTEVRPGMRPRGSIGHSEWNMGLSKAVILAVCDLIVEFFGIPVGILAV